jgi:hypothetical protein
MDHINLVNKIYMLNPIWLSTKKTKTLSKALSKGDRLTLSRPPTRLTYGSGINTVVRMAQGHSAQKFRKHTLQR